MALRAKTQQVTRPVHGLSPMARAHAEGQGLPDFYGTGEDDLKTANVFTVSCYAARAQYLVTLHGLACKRQESPKVGQPTAIRPREPFKLAKRVALGSQRVHREFTGGSQRVHRRFATHQAVVVDSRTPKPIRQTPASFDAMRLTIGLRAKTSPYCQALIGGSPYRLLLKYAILAIPACLRSLRRIEDPADLQEHRLDRDQSLGRGTDWF